MYLRMHVLTYVSVLMYLLGEWSATVHQKDAEWYGIMLEKVVNFLRLNVDSEDLQNINKLTISQRNYRLKC